ncbi:hypothetical protein AB0O07_18830 [Streptomyces sp. NPDC093085]|uniref:hypothetical protein n=1 Tax=Streptomyces sp. NPDC093085 TaxID=3155068 RepID=UPI00343284EC
MAKRKVRRQARKILGEDPVALVWCELHGPIPTPPKEIQRAAGKVRLKPKHHWLYYVAIVVGCFIFIPLMLIDQLDKALDRLLAGKQDRAQRSGGSGNGGAKRRAERRPPPNRVFDGDWNLAAGQLLLRWYADSPNARRLVLLGSDRIHVAASPGRRLFATRADNFQTVREYAHTEVRAEGDAGQPRGFATFRLRFPDGSWLELGQLHRPDDADHFLRTISG